ncbi:MAG: ferredoxin family protein, partial [Phycisphaeraceae bacterium]
MSLADQTTLRIVLYEGEGAEPMDSEVRLALITGLLERGFSVTRTGPGEVAAADRSALFVMGRFGDAAPPAVENDQGVPIRVHSLNGGGVSEMLGGVEAFRQETSAVAHGEWKPWFPVIDYDRCTNCMQCLSFCLFDVYGVSSEQKIEVHNNDNCKTNCPACSRVCPEAAIMFP